MSNRTDVTLGYDRKIKRVSVAWHEWWNGAECMRIATFDEDVVLKEGDTVSVMFVNEVPQFTVETYEDALLEPEWEIFT